MTESAARDRNALIVIDVQRGFDSPEWGTRNNPDAEAHIRALLAAWRAHGRPVVLVRHDSTEPGSPLSPGQAGNDLQDGVEGPHDLMVTKSVNSSFYGTPDLDAWLRSNDIGAVTICGITTNHCCETTARMAANLGYAVDFVLDATYTFDRIGPDGEPMAADDLARATATSLHGEFATVRTTASVLADLPT